MLNCLSYSVLSLHILKEYMLGCVRKMNEKSKENIEGGEFSSPQSKKAVDIDEIIDNPFDLPLVRDFLGDQDKKNALLVDYSVDESGFGEFAILEFEGDGTFRVNSDAVVDQVKRIISKFDGEKKPVNVVVSRKTNQSGQEYFSLLG